MNNNFIPTVLNWSSGKDAALAYKLLCDEGHYKVTHLLTTVNEEYDRVVMHGVREELLDAQADRMGLPLIKVKLPATPTDDAYKQAMQNTLAGLKGQGIYTAAFGDIFLDDLKQYREQQLASVSFNAVFPLWKKDTRELVQLVEDAGIEAVIVCVNEKFLSKEFLGRKIGRDFLRDLPANVDPCGENGEFHTFVYNAPYFSSPIIIQQGEVVYKSYTPSANDPDKWNTGFYFLDIY
ncbi:MAG: adenine nucleotide alpha hydrolase [Bacteroidetes bacterium]|nr:adenine nucleotide alpha hydrolase [Bacteroidota bacterium]